MVELILMFLFWVLSIIFLLLSPSPKTCEPGDDAVSAEPDNFAEIARKLLPIIAVVFALLGLFMLIRFLWLLIGAIALSYP